MDRFKFRVWVKDTKEYHYHGATFFAEVIGNDNYVIEQCTGLKDKNGRLIYEGDILGGIYGGYISWCDKCKSFEFFMPEINECMACSGDVLWQEIVEDDGTLEVVGNIHENADLLGEE